MKEMSTYSLTRTRVEEASTKARYITGWKQIANQEESRSCVYHNSIGINHSLPTMGPKRSVTRQ